MQIIFTFFLSFPLPKQLSIKALNVTQNLQNITAENIKIVAFRMVKIAAAEMLLSY